MKIKCKRLTSDIHVGFKKGTVGVFHWGGHYKWQGVCLWIRLPDGVTALPVIHGDDPFTNHNGLFVWGWDGNCDAPTLSPSIHNAPDGWHGYLKEGYLIEASLAQPE